jgi:multidrug efflux pump subunit AcrA (membrane-fusion protein)
MADVSQMWIVLDVREQDAEVLEIGQPVTFTAGAVTVNSSLSWISTEVDPKTRTVEVRCIAENPTLVNETGQPTGQRLLRANQFGLGRVRVHQQADALVVPTKAVQRCDGSHVAFVQCGDRSFEARKIQVGVVTEDFTEVVEGLEGTPSIVSEGSHVLKAELQRRYTAASAP